MIPPTWLQRSTPLTPGSKPILSITALPPAGYRHFRAFTHLGGVNVGKSLTYTMEWGYARFIYRLNVVPMAADIHIELVPVEGGGPAM